MKGGKNVTDFEKLFEDNQNLIVNYPLAKANGLPASSSS